MLEWILCLLALLTLGAAPNGRREGSARLLQPVGRGREHLPHLTPQGRRDETLLQSRAPKKLLTGLLVE